MADLGVFSTIENLEKSNGRSKEENLKTSRDYVQLKGLQMKHAKLEQKKHELEHQLDQRQQGLRKLKNFEGSVDEIGDDAKDVLLNLEEKKLLNVLQAYRLTGSTLESIHENIIRLRLDTCYNGKYSQPLYAELHVTRDSFSLKRHTLPKFIPEDTIKECLDLGLSEFCSRVHTHLRPYVARREEAFITQDKFEAVIDGEICSSPSFDYIEIKLKSSTGGIQCIKLLYEDILLENPTLVQITVDNAEESNLEDDTVETLRKDLEQLPLSEAFKTFFADEQ